MAYDVGQITRELQQRFRLFDPPIDTRSKALALEVADTEGTTENLATPENLRVLLAALRGVTEDLLAARESLFSDFTAGKIAAVVFVPAGLGGVFLDEHADVLANWDQRMAQWRGRLGAYDDAVAKAPVGDRQDVLWSVTAPLLLGFFGGEASKLPQQPLDAVTPFMLANQLRVLDEWRDERWRLFLEELEAGVANVVDVGVSALGVLVPLAVVAGGIWAVSQLRR